jgi:hypothetical protein
MVSLDEPEQEIVIPEPKANELIYYDDPGAYSTFGDTRDYNSSTNF